MRKCDIAINMLGVCKPDMHFVYVLPSWEGSVADGRVLRDTISRRHGLKVPNGCYYLVDAGYTNCEGFLAPFRGQRYHLNEWRQGYQPSTPEEFFNMKHASARNVIERCFGLLKLRWGILRTPSFYPLCQVFPNEVFLPKVLEEPKGNGFQKKMLRWLLVWSTCIMLEPLMRIWDSKPAI
ncbi:uncharacterized protein [Gossypium hirsutum]|uniref:DDE Tnp4 domain-containing protein n=1 Tax=Gossypium hirsutum TaxID=3635 RepID=A0ABM2YW22_GOSHI|nr:uncharacterized protein LOC121207580 [Gossypium hirsutum]